MATLLTDEQLNKLSTKRLLTYYRSIRTVDTNPSVSCQGIDWEAAYKEMDEYRAKIKNMLNQREHIK